MDQIVPVSWERLSLDTPVPSSASETQPPDAFRQNAADADQYHPTPALHDRSIAAGFNGDSVRSARRSTRRSTRDDTNWIVVLKDVGPDVSVMSVREGEREVPKILHEREITRGWLKASHRATDPTRSKPWWPWHPLTRERRKSQSRPAQSRSIRSR